MKNSGFSLIESLVMISIISILTAISVSALPAIRSHQALVADTEQIRSLLLDSKQRALNQVRPAECVEANGGIDDENSQRCSDVGIVFVGGNVIQYADSYKGNQRYDADANGKSLDHEIARYPLQSVIVKGDSTNPNHFLFFGNPPSVDLYVTGQKAAPGNVYTILLRANTGKNKQERTIEISSFGTINIK